MTDENRIPVSTIPRVDVESSRIAQLGHDAASNTLAVQFRGKGGAPGPVYHYDNFTAADYEKLFAAESIGAHFERVIRPASEKHPYTRMSDPVQESDPAVDEAA